MRALSWFMSLSMSVAMVSGFAACSLSDIIEPRPGSDSGTRDALPPGPTGTSDADGGPAPENKGLSLAPRGIVLANATQSFAAFRLCKAPQGSQDSLSTSASRPVPTALMPRANVSGVDVASAVTVVLEVVLLELVEVGQTLVAAVELAVLAVSVAIKVAPGAIETRIVRAV
mgnify:CR=1 FL=1